MNDEDKTKEELIDEIRSLRKKLKDKNSDELMLIEQKLRESEERYRLISENANDLILIVNENRKILYANKAFQRILGYSIDELEMRDALEFIHPENVDSSIKSFQNSLKSGETRAEVRFRHKKGHHLWFEAVVKLLKNLENKSRLLLISRNITDKKKIDEKLKESEEKYRIIIESVKELIAIINGRNRYEFINEEAYFKELGYKKEEIIGKRTDFLIHPEDLEKYVKSLIEADSKGEGSLIARYKHKNGGYIWIETYGKIFSDTKGNSKALVVGKNITDKLEAEQKLMESKEKYQEAFIKSEFLKDVFAHDINNILQNILSSSEILSLYINDPEKMDDTESILKIIRDQVKRGSNLIETVQKLSNMEEYKASLTNVEIIKVLNKAINHMTQNLEEQTCDIQVESAEKNYFINANELLIDIFENIIINSIKHNNNRIKEIKIKIFREESENRKIIRMEFRDNGIGVEDIRKEDVFLRGFGSSSDQKGMGIGLYLVKKIVEQYGGEIWVEDNIKGDYSKGSNFIIEIQEADI